MVVHIETFEHSKYRISAMFQEIWPRAIIHTDICLKVYFGGLWRSGVWNNLLLKILICLLRRRILQSGSVFNSFGFFSLNLFDNVKKMTGVKWIFKFVLVVMEHLMWGIANERDIVYTFVWSLNSMQHFVIEQVFIQDSKLYSNEFWVIWYNDFSVVEAWIWIKFGKWGSNWNC